MKNILTILTNAGVELTDEQKTSIEKDVRDNYKPVEDWQKQHDKVANLEDQLKATKEALAKFDNVDADALNKQIEDLKADLDRKDSEYQAQIADRDFNDLLKESIGAVNGKNAKAITALLDIEALKSSKNQKEDMSAALKILSEAEDSKMLFGEVENKLGEGDPIGTVTKKGGLDDSWLDQMKAAAGISEPNEE